jgi:3',5'-cyclic AMP phosphodiesterase CpdA
MTFLLAQITDTHIVGSDHDGELYVDNNARLAQAVEHVMAESVLPDAVLLTGDLTDIGSEEEMELVLDLIEPLSMPVLSLPGNHDRRPTFRRWFDMPWADGDHLSWVVPFDDFNLVGLDTLVGGQAGANSEIDHGGLFDEAREAWLNDTLESTSDRPTAIAMHHPPFDSGIWWMDGMGLRNRGRFIDVVSSHDHVTRIFCGHLHRPITTMVGGAVATTGISTVHQVQLDLRPDCPVQVICDPPGYQLHVFDGAGWTSHTRHFASNDGPIDPAWA